MNWTAISEALPPKDSLVLVAGWSTGTPETERVFAAARLLDAWDTEDADGRCAEVWADDAEFNALTFTPTHWQPIHTLAVLKAGLRDVSGPRDNRWRSQGIVG